MLIKDAHFNDNHINHLDELDFAMQQHSKAALLIILQKIFEDMENIF